ncbi:MAG: hypothetical protein Q9191_005932 [Dirinaria sp. TL-2023a]
MNDRHQQNRRLPSKPVWPRNTLNSRQAPRVDGDASSSAVPEITWTEKPSSAGDFSRSSTSFRVPIRSTSEKEEIKAIEKRPSDLSPNRDDERSEDPGLASHDNLSLLGDSSSLFATPPSIAAFTFRSSPPSATMVVEREPPKAPLSPRKPNQQPPQPVIKPPQQAEFGKASPLRSRVESSVFNIPKAHHARPEHHRSAQPIYPNYQQRQIPNQSDGQVVRPQQSVPQPSGPPYNDKDVVEIQKPANIPSWTLPPAPPTAMFSSRVESGGFTAINPPAKPGGIVNLPAGGIIDFTSITEPALLDPRFGAADPYDYIEASKANENIKALLEGAFEDEEDKPRTRGRKKKFGAALEELTNKLQNLEVKKEEETVDADSAAEEEEEDDGKIEGLNVRLLPHQVDGVEWMREKEIGTKKKNGVLPKGGILADDMGLGKTIQSISVILTNTRPPKTSVITNDKKSLPNVVDKCTLVVGPLALIRQWDAEIKNKVCDSHKLKVCVHHGPQRTKRFEDLRKYDVVITTYQILVSEHAGSSKGEGGPQFGCFGIHWYRVILDEAHTIKNRNAKATQACYALRAEYRWCLTGTPMQNNLDELQSLIRFLRIKPYNDLKIWKSQITEPMRNGRGNVAMKRLQFYLKAFMKRRTKEVLKQEGALNPGGKPSAEGAPSNGFKITARKIEKVSAEFTPEERSFYSRLEQRTDESIDAMMSGAKMSYASALTMLLRLRQACNHPQLVGGPLAQDQDALTTGQTQSTQTPRKAKVAEKEVDDIADLLGGLSVQTKRCDMCQIELGKEEANTGAVRCTDCEENLMSRIEPKVKRSKKKTHHSKSRSKPRPTKAPSKGAAKRKVVLDDSEEENDGDWLVPEDQRPGLHLGKAGGSDDENAEGGGEDIGSSDSDTGDESSIQVLGFHTRKVISLDTSDEDVDNASEASSSSESASDSETDTSSTTDTLAKRAPTTSAKITQLLRILHAESGAHKFIVFSQFTSMLDLIEPFLRTRNLRFTRYDGSMRNDHREASLERLRNDASTRILLCSLKCGSLGLNLTAASRVVILEPFWNPFVEEQAIDRVHRLNQTRDVLVYKLTVADTVEARILDLQEKKRALAEAAIEGKAAAGKLSMKDILNLFRRDAEVHDHPAEGAAAPGVGRGGLLAGPMAAAAEQMQAFRSDRNTGRKVNPVGGSSSSSRPKEDAVFGRRW